MKFEDQYPELTWLKGNVNATPEGESKDNKEYERTVCGIELLYYVLDDQYEKFTECQNPKRLSKTTFEKIRTYTKSIIQTKDDLDAITTYLIINDLGKIHSVIDEIKEKLNIESVDHDDLLFEGLKNIEHLSPSFDKLSKEYQDIILDGLSTKFNFGQFIQSENLPYNLPIGMNSNKKSFDFYMIHILYDIAGAAGHTTRKGTPIIDDDFWNKFILAEKCLESIESQNDLKYAYFDYLDGRKKVLGLNNNDESSYAVTRICNMMRISDKKLAQEMLFAFQNQELNVRAILEKELNMTGIDDKGILLYYAPAMLSNAWNSFKEKSIKDYFDFMLPILANIYIQARSYVSKIDANPVTTFMISDIAKEVNDPFKLMNKKFVFKQIGKDFEVTCKDINIIKTKDIYYENPIYDKTVMIGMGGGSDCIQATLIARFINITDMSPYCQDIISIRTAKTQSQDSHGKINQKRIVKNPKKIIDNDIYLIGKNTTGSGRFLENIPAEETYKCKLSYFDEELIEDTRNLKTNMYLIIDREDGKLKEKIEKTLQYIGDVKNIVCVDTGGDVLYPMKSDNKAMATPDQDRRVLDAVCELNLDSELLVVALGVDSPDNAEDILRKADAEFVTFDESHLDILKTYEKWDMTGDNDKKFGKTPLALQEAIKGKRGWTCLNIPLKYVLDDDNPWIPFVHIQDVTNGFMSMDAKKALKAIQSFE